MSTSVLASIFQHANEGGISRLYGVPSTERYRRVPASSLLNSGLHKKLSSVDAFSSSTAATTLLLFEPVVSFDPTDYRGRFLQVNNASSGDELKVNLGDHAFNDKASSMLLVATDRGTEFRLSFRDTFLDTWKDTIDEELGDAASRIGDPVLTWEMFPVGFNHLNSDRIYLKISQKLNINIDGWADYDARISYWVLLFVNADLQLAGKVKRWSYWVESGIKAGAIGDQLEPKVVAGMKSINSVLATRLAAVSGFDMEDLYYLPGRQVTPAGTGVTTGLTTDDVTIVAVIKT